jgi:lipoprotein-anchoring transpeptidase ErfK/SrfK
MMSRRSAWIPVVGFALLLAACGSSSSAGLGGNGGSGSSTPAPNDGLVISSTPRDGATKVSIDSALMVQVTNGKISSVVGTGQPTLTGNSTAAPATATTTAQTTTETDNLVGALNTSGTSWSSKSQLVPNSSYELQVTALTNKGEPVTKTITFATAAPKHRLTLSMFPEAGATVGVAEPLVVYFDQPVTNRELVQSHLTVTPSKPIGPAAWHWFSSTEVQYRPETYWPANTDVTLSVDMAGVRASTNTWGTRNYSETVHIGRSLMSYVDGKTHEMTIKQDGKTVETFPISTGKPGYETWEGILVTEEKHELIVMDSSSVNIFGPQAYKLGVHYAVRVTNSGTFVHAAPWDTHLGKSNTSHGCIHLSTKDAIWFFDNSLSGDPVIVTNTGGGKVGYHNGFTGWNMPWSQWTSTEISS